MSRLLETIQRICLTLCCVAACKVEAVWVGPSQVSSTKMGVVNAMDGSGNVTAVWTDWYAEKLGIFWSNYPKSEERNTYWSNEATLFTTKGRLFQNLQIAIDSSWNSIVVWQESDLKQSKVRASTRPYKGVWSKPFDLSPLTMERMLIPQVAISRDGHAVVVFELEGKIKSATFNFQSGWSDIVDVSQSGSLPKVGIDSIGNAVAIWQSEGAVQISCLPYGGTWSSPVTLSNEKGGETPALVINSEGSIAAAWKADSSIFVTVSHIGGEWSTPVPLKASPYINKLHIAIDEQGNAVVIWEQEDLDDSTAFPIKTPRYLQASYCSRAAVEWSSPVVISANSDGGDHNPRVAFDGSGNAYAVWNSYSAVLSAILPFKEKWTDVMVIHSGLYGLLTNPQICVDRSGRAVVNWSDEWGVIRAAEWLPDSLAANVDVKTLGVRPKLAE